MRRSALWLAVSLAGVAACAIQEAPSGGPEDKTPPRVVATTPAAGSAGVRRDAEIQIVFSEPMRHRRLERQISFQPSASIRKARWKGATMVLTLDEPLRADTTYVVELRGGFSDAHGVTNRNRFQFAFATAAHIDSGRVAGRVIFRRKPTEKGVVRLFVARGDSVVAVAAARPDRETTTAKDGSFHLDYLPANGARLLIWAFQDNNNNFTFDPEGEVGAVAPDTVVLTPVRPRLEAHEFFLVDPKEPAEITGRIRNRTGVDTIAVSVALHEVSDSLPPTYYTRCNVDGGYRFTTALEGEYVLWAFLDLEPDSLCGRFPCEGDTVLGCPEPCVSYPDTIVVRPGDKIELKSLGLRLVPAEE